VENKKIKNAQVVVYNGIKFRSKLEKSCYIALLEQGIKVSYEVEAFSLFDGFNPKVLFITKNRFKRKNKNLKLLSKRTAIDSRREGTWYYTPDFYFQYGKYKIYIEAKGMYNDVARYKRKLFRKVLDRIQENDSEHIYEYWEIYSVKQLQECINYLKQQLN
jgi:hypothetical protein